jgi:hypothetical protein
MSFKGTTDSSDWKGDRKLPIKQSSTDNDVTRQDTSIAEASGITRKSTPAGDGVKNGPDGSSDVSLSE